MDGEKKDGLKLSRGGGHHQNQAFSPVGLPDVQGVWVRDAPFVSLLLQEVKKVLDSQGRAVRRDAEDGLEKVIQELLESSLKRERRKRWSHMSRNTPL